MKHLLITLFMCMSFCAFSQTYQKAKEAFNSGEYEKASSIIDKIPGDSKDFKKANKLKKQIGAKIQEIAQAKLSAKQDSILKVQELRKTALAAFDKIADEFKPNIIWYHEKKPTGYKNQVNWFTCRGKLLQVKEGESMSQSILMEITYYANDWLFIDKLKIKIGDKIYEPRMVKVYREVGKTSLGRIGETCRIEIDEELLRAGSQTIQPILVRFEGEEKYADVDILIGDSFKKMRYLLEAI